jgi:hypothetical protein
MKVKETKMETKISKCEHKIKEEESCILHECESNILNEISQVNKKMIEIKESIKLKDLTNQNSTNNNTLILLDTYTDQLKNLENYLSINEASENNNIVPITKDEMMKSINNYDEQISTLKLRLKLYDTSKQDDN